MSTRKRSMSFRGCGKHVCCRRCDARGARAWSATYTWHFARPFPSLNHLGMRENVLAFFGNLHPRCLTGPVCFKAGGVGTRTEPLSCVRRDVRGMAYADDSDIIVSISAEGLAKMMNAIWLFFEATGRTVLREEGGAYAALKDRPKHPGLHRSS